MGFHWATAEATRYHVGLEAWMAYHSDWNYIQSTYTSVAPKDLGSMGYTGPSSSFFSGRLQENAYSTEGLGLQFFRNWNASWKQPWKYFGSISSIATSQLAPCSGWALEEYMQKAGAGRLSSGEVAATIHNMPVAAAVAASWGDYTTIPQSGDVLFFWWSPDPTFIEMNPLSVKFPKYNAKEWKRGYWASASSQQSINTIVSRDLELLAPIVERFADRLDLPITEMNAMLLDQKQTAATWQHVTCRWLKANRHLWQSWIPDESECFPGFGLYDSALEDFRDQRVNASNLVCQASEIAWSIQLRSRNGN
eukprot:Skav208637  [mRNA]  locus=scaffold1081:17987:19487:- [translate_table: standard]